MAPNQIELLAPAKDLACGIAAVNHGADAVYIGAPRFGARAAAGNSIQDIEELVRYAHQFHARVYITLNTLLTDSELDDAVVLIRQLHDLGADALIIQDMGLLECDLPPIPLHASTQTNNRTIEKVRFLEKVGFDQVVLARELSIEEIRSIRQATEVALECFIHGALCVSYSGQCYISEVVSGRSANRGECAQFCRHRYILRDRRDRVLAKDRYLLSLKDLDLSRRIGELIDAGVSSLKIEGRLKGISYVKNVTAFYRQLLDDHIERDSSLQSSSSGRCRFSFTPDPARSFNRGRTEYFIDGPGATPGQLDTSKSLGELIGRVVRAGRSSFAIKSAASLQNGDGLCYFTVDGKLAGLKANRVDNETVHHREHFSPPVGTMIYRNHDVAFAKMLEASEQCRLLSVQMLVEESEKGLACIITDEDGCVSRTELECVKETSRKPGGIRDVIVRQMKKSGGTLFFVERVEVGVGDSLFIPAATINQLRRDAFEAHRLLRIENYTPERRSVIPNSIPWLSSKVDCLDNITNQQSAAFYRRHGVTEFAFPSQGPRAEADLPLMTMRYCVRAQLGMCLKEMTGENRSGSGVLILSDNTGEYELNFDCHRCEMTLRHPRKN